MKDKKVVITRSLHQSEDLSKLLLAHGAEPLVYHCIEIVPPDDTTELDSALRTAGQGSFDWIIFTSANTVVSVSTRLKQLSIPSEDLGQAKIAAIGPATRAAVQDLLGIQVAIIPEHYVAESLVATLAPVTGKRFLLPQSNLARSTLSDDLSKAGAQVSSITAYKTVIGRGGVDLPRLLSKNEIDAITFTSPSTVRNFIKRLNSTGREIHIPETVCIACIGPITANAARQQGLAVDVVPGESTIESLVSGLKTYFSHSYVKENDFERVLKSTPPSTPPE